MNSGIVASRYAKAFLKYVQGEGDGKTVYSQSCVLVHVMNEIPQFKEYIKIEDVMAEVTKALSVFTKDIGRPFSFMSYFGIRVILASQKELESVLSSSIVWNNL